jgi:hypothetical protein
MELPKNAPDPRSSTIGSLHEGHLHAALKAWYAQPGDRTEVTLGGYVIDVIHAGGLVEVQTGSFHAIRRKLEFLIANHAVRLVYPIAQERWIVRMGEDGALISRRKSPQHGRVFDLFAELVSLPHLMAHPNLTLEVLLIQEEQVRRFDQRRAWRRKGWVVEERRLLQVSERHLFQTPTDFAALLPPALPTPFTTAQLAAAANIPRRLAQQMAYCLRQWELLVPIGKAHNAVLYQPIGTPT